MIQMLSILLTIQDWDYRTRPRARSLGDEYFERVELSVIDLLADPLTVSQSVLNPNFRLIVTVMTVMQLTFEQNVGQRTE